MDKKVTTAAGIALGATFIAGAGFAAYKYFRQKWANASSLEGGSEIGNGFAHSGGIVGNGLFKSTSLYDNQGLYAGQEAGNGLVGGGLFIST